MNRLRSPRIAKPSRTRLQNFSTWTSRPEEEDHAGAGEQRKPDQRRPLVEQEELPVDRRDAGVDLVCRQHADRERPDHQRARDEEVEDRLDDERRGERRVGRARQAVLDEVDLDHVAAAGGQDRVDPDAGRVRTERAAVLEPAPGVGGAHDVLPGPRAEEQLDHVARERQPECRPLHIGEVVEEDRDRMQKGAHRRLR